MSLGSRCAAWVAISLGLLAAQGCDELSEFKTDDDEVFRGEVLGSESEPEAGSFIRSGFPSFTELDLVFDPAIAARETGEGPPASPVSPGRLSTRYPCPRAQADCEPGELVEGPLFDVALERFENLAHDALGQYDFPGGGRLRNYIFGARFVSGEGEQRAARHAMVFLSLMTNGRIELRVIAPSARGQGDTEDLHPALFGVFVLERQRR